MATQLNFNRERLTRIFFFTAFIFILYQLCLIARPFLTALIVAAMLALAFFPLNLRMRKVIKNPALASLILTLCVFLAAVIPLVGGIWFLLRDADRLIPTVKGFVETLTNMNVVTLRDKIPLFLQHLIDPAIRFFRTMNVDVESVALEYATAIGTRITAIGALFARHAFLAFVNGIVLLVALF